MVGPSRGLGDVQGSGVDGFATSLKKGGGRSLFWSEVSVQGRPRVLVLDAVADRYGWEAEATQRIAASLIRRDIPVVSGAPVVVAESNDISTAIKSAYDFNCIFLAARADKSPSAGECWSALQASLSGETKLFAMCTWDSADPDTSSEVLVGEETFAPVAVAQQEPMTGRGASLFFMKFFAELDMHSESTNSMSGKMVWFGHSKAREIMRRRHYAGRVGLRS